MLYFQVLTQQISAVSTTLLYKWQPNKGQWEPWKLHLSVFQLTVRKISRSLTAFCLVYSRARVMSVSQVLETFVSGALAVTQHTHQMQPGLECLTFSQSSTTNLQRNIWRVWRNSLEKGSCLLTTAANCEVRNQTWLQKAQACVDGHCHLSSHVVCPISCQHWTSLETSLTVKVHCRRNFRVPKQSFQSHARIVKKGRRKWWFVDNVAKPITARGNARKRIGRNIRNLACREESDGKPQVTTVCIFFASLVVTQGLDIHLYDSVLLVLIMTVTVSHLIYHRVS